MDRLQMEPRRSDPYGGYQAGLAWRRAVPAAPGDRSREDQAARPGGRSTPGARHPVSGAQWWSQLTTRATRHAPFTSCQMCRNWNVPQTALPCSAWQKRWAPSSTAP